MKKKIPICSLLFCVFLSVLLLLFIVLPKKEYSSAEKRYLAAMPAVTWKGITDGSFGRDFETYLSDRFPFRSFFVGVNAYYNLLLGNNGASGYYNARDGFLIAKPADFKQERLLKNISHINSFAEKTDIPAAFLLIPTTGYMLRDRLPYNALSYHDEQVYGLFADSLSEKVRLIDVRSRFSEEGSPDALYYRTDHHITAEGAYTAYEAVCEELGLEAVPRSAYSVETVDGFYGTAYSGSGYFLEKPDRIELWKNEALFAEVYISDDGTENEKHDGVFYPEHLDEDDKYPVYLDGNHGYTHIHNENAENGTILLIKDSFAHCLSCFLCEHFRDLYMIDLRYYKYPLSDFIKEKQIDRLLYVYGVDNFLTDTNISWLQ